MKKIFLLSVIASALLLGCKKDKSTTTTTTTPPNLIFKFKFDSTQARLNNLGQPAAIPAGHSAQSPVFYGMSAHYIELTPNANTPVGGGKILYNGPTTYAGGDTAIDFSKESIKGNGEQFFSIPISSVAPGTYQYLRISLAYQNYDIVFYYNSLKITGRLASFIGFDTYVTNYKIKDSTVTVNASKKQGYWGFETIYGVSKGQAPAGATTVVNPIESTSPIPAGSCLVTGGFATALTITGNETADVVVTVSLSTNKSFEWKDANGNGLYEPTAGDTVVDMGIRGMIPTVQ